VESRRGYPSDDEQRWYDGEDWERGRHGVPAPSAGPGAAYSGESATFGGPESFAATENAGLPDNRGSDGYERRFNSPARYNDPLTDSAAGMIPAIAGDPVEVSRRPVEAIDVAALRTPGGVTPGAGPGEAAQPAYAAQYSGPPAPPDYPAGEFPQVMYSPPAQYGSAGGSHDPHANPHNPLSAPTAAVNMIQPSRSALYQSRKPVVAIVLGVLTVLFEIPALRMLGSATIEDVVPVPGVVAGTFLVLGLPAFAYGVFGLLGAPNPAGLAPWLRLPLLCLPLGVLLFVLAALAAG
jgi:hypothetical protein